MEEKPALADFKQQLSQQSDIQFIDVSFDVETTQWQTYLQDKKPTGLQLISKNQQETSRKLGFGCVPMHLIAEKDGNFIKVRNFAAAKNVLLEKIQNQ